MSETFTPVQIAEKVQAQRAFFHSGQTRSLDFRLQALLRLQSEIRARQKDILHALRKDFGKPSFEGYATEVGFILDEISHFIKHLPQWVEPETVPTPLVHQPAQSMIYPEPYGVALIIAPWNYPFQLLLGPMLGALIAGNCAVLKPSEFTPATGKVVKALVEACFDPAHICVIEGALPETQALLEERFDTIFFTGSTAVGRIVMEKAARHLTPVTLELGGKSPCIVDHDVDLSLVARRIAWGKFVNAGQTCVAPDYLYVPEEKKAEMIAEISSQILAFYGPDPSQSPDFARIINERHFQRLTGYLNAGRVVVGGRFDRSERYLSPTVLDDVSWEDPIMQEEIFGPILPVLAYTDLEEVIEAIAARPHPLALYFFSENQARQERILKSLSFGGGCINDTLVHLSSPHLPFGGVGASGMGAYHGKASFDTFSHRKSVMQRQLKMDLPVRYPPYGAIKQQVIRQIFR
ncbi:aldehyde dehydrogenase family protein [bacterium (Candidatus Blackallbacteria) CG17_big_fil_post_rev_8_21_14_2_50_48_46]|uniref:Aldehyde dehydrogenase n=1 Tax=bacterium (Candidatus Blackallbacteria) CG17_big_fil_post_rev_8_21_14_2_50_48_46 TaxID=2014261 RepID=A0A2M7G949_9BACT|nr:MAG: aldehyde dehydrogenase family protein [bacterium (Candidatus Blackallbacteria) CG18_big_fil_WC_8_21_14_2_50_49_26]PIW18571.1 MAG: aldehyde dehydrogenase family protein [bacterium (Candidatus Blackallbacteria) CG17_big_fil_post_rev_8_21_14_2_50_48_46]PIW46444.1 MAG: aldehyde dehydrogenase family protein [bacterium (Candidatus Blackallbacteria) CG13_big_fil_rev_8_21_14_2_50_49_14]